MGFKPLLLLAEASGGSPSQRGVHDLSNKLHRGSHVFAECHAQQLDRDILVRCLCLRVWISSPPLDGNRGMRKHHTFRHQTSHTARDPSGNHSVNAQNGRMMTVRLLSLHSSSFSLFTPHSLTGEFSGSAPTWQGQVPQPTDSHPRPGTQPPRDMHTRLRDSGSVWGAKSPREGQPLTGRWK